MRLARQGQYVKNEGRPKQAAGRESRSQSRRPFGGSGLNLINDQSDVSTAGLDRLDATEQVAT